jgi:hypothetical protein
VKVIGVTNFTGIYLSILSVSPRNNRNEYSTDNPKEELSAVFHAYSMPIPASNSKLWLMKKKQRRALALGATILSVVTAFGALMAFLDSYGQTDQARPTQAIVVLGSHVNKRGEAGASLRARALHAASLYRRGVAPYIICTGGVGDYPPAEARIAAKLLRTQGVPPMPFCLKSNRAQPGKTSVSPPPSASNAAGSAWLSSAIPIICGVRGVTSPRLALRLFLRLLPTPAPALV